MSRHFRKSGATLGLLAATLMGGSFQPAVALVAIGLLSGYKAGLPAAGRIGFDYQLARAGFSNLAGLCHSPVDGKDPAKPAACHAGLCATRRSRRDATGSRVL